MKTSASICFTLGMLLAACSNEDALPTAEFEVPGNAITEITISTKDYVTEGFPETRGITYTGSGAPFAWDEKDTLGIYPDTGDQLAFSMSAGIGTKTANVDGGAWGLKATSGYAAYSPFNRWNFFTDREHITLNYTGQVENGIADASHLGRFDYQAANTTKASDGHLNFELQRLNCILILRLTVPQAGSYTKLTLTADEEVFTTQANLALGDSFTFTPTKKSKSVSLGLENVKTTSANQTADFLIMLAPADLTGKTFTASLTGANGYVYKGTKTPTSAYSAGKATRTSITLKLDENATVGIGGEFSSDDSTM